MTEKQKTTTDAPASVTYTIQRNGFQILFTVRAEAGAELLEAMDTIEKRLTEKGYIPQEKRGFGFPKKEKEIVPNRKCPMCGQDLVYGTTKDGKKFIKCSTQKYDFQTKQTTGCKFFEWDNLSSNKEQF